MFLGKPVEHDFFKCDGLGVGTSVFNDFSRLGRPRNGTLEVDGKVFQTRTMPRTLPRIPPWHASFDIGSDTLTGGNDTGCEPHFAPSATLHKLSIKVDRPQLSPADIARLQAAMEAKD